VTEGRIGPVEYRDDRGRVTGPPAPEEEVLRSAMTRIARGGTASLAGAAAAGVSSFVLVLVVTRLYDRDVAGSLFAAISVFLILVAIVELGVDQGFVRFVAWYRASGRQASIPGLLRVGYTPVLGAAVVAGGVGLVIANQLAAIVGGEDTTQIATMLRVLSCTLPVAAAYDITLAATRGYGTMRPTVLIEGLVRPVMQPVAVVVAATLDAGVVGLALAWCMPYGVGLVAAIAALRSAQTARGTPVSPPERESPAREFWSFTAPRGLGRVCQVALQRADVLIVAALRGPGDAAIYTAVTRFLVLGQMAMQAVQRVLQPKLAELLAIDNRAVADAVFKRATAWFVAVSWPLYLLLVAFAEPVVVGIFGDAYQPGADGLVVLSVAMLVATAAGPVDVLLLMAGRSGLSLINTALSLGMDVGLCLVLVPDHGVLGAAVAWAIAILTRNALGVAQVRSQLRMTAWSSALTRVVVAAVLTFGAIPLVLSPAVGGLPGVAVVSTICAAGYGLLLWRAREQLGLAAFAAVTPAAVTRSAQAVGLAIKRHREDAKT
jgi:O-antigen/teichoic acid export membrane protein